MANLNRKVQVQTVTQQQGVIHPGFLGMQFVVNNPTAMVVKLSGMFATTAAYEYIVKAQSMFVSPLVNFEDLFWFVDSYAPGAVQPIIYVYPRWFGSPGVYALT